MHALPSGLLYRVLREGDGEAHPLRDSQCKCHYEGRTAQEYDKSPKGKKFDSSYDRGETTSFAPSGVIAGWTEAMQLMVEGDKWEMFIPSELGYGDSGQGGDIGAGDCLVFTMEIIQIEGPSKPAERGPPPFTDFTSVDAATFDSSAPTVLAVLRQPLASGKLFAAFKAAARRQVKSGTATPDFFGLIAASELDGKSYRTDAWLKLSATEKSAWLKLAATGHAARLKLAAPAVYVDEGTGYKKCSVGRPTEVSIDDMATKIAECAKNVQALKEEM